MTALMMVIILLIIQLLMQTSDGLNYTHRITYQSFRSSVESQLIFTLQLSPLSLAKDEENHYLEFNSSSRRFYKLIVICTSDVMGTHDTPGGSVQCMDDSKQSFVVMNTSGPELVTGFILHTERGQVTDIVCKLNFCTCIVSDFDETVNKIKVLSHTKRETPAATWQRNRRALEVSEDLTSKLDGGVDQLDATTNRTFHIPIIVFVDSYLIRKFCDKLWAHCCPSLRITENYTLCSEIRSYYLNIMAATKQLYADIDNDDLNIVLSVINVEAVAETAPYTSYFDRFLSDADYDEIDLNIALEEANIIVQGHALYTDAAVVILFMGHDLSGALGAAYIGEVCNFPKTAIIKERFGYSSFFTISHELGHVLGSPHDGTYTNCGSKQNQLMGWVFNLAKTELSYVFSCCSLASIYSELRAKSCTFSPPRVPSVQLNTSSKYLGEVISREMFCQLTNSGSYFSCPSDLSCKGVRCRKSRDTNVCDFYEGIGLPALNGLSCDSSGDKWCMHGFCVPRNSTGFNNAAQKTCDVTKRLIKAEEEVTDKQTTPVMNTGQVISHVTVAVLGFITFCAGMVVFSQEYFRRKNIKISNYNDTSNRIANT